MYGNPYFLPARLLATSPTWSSEEPKLGAAPDRKYSRSGRIQASRAGSTWKRWKLSFAAPEA